LRHRRSDAEGGQTPGNRQARGPGSRDEQAVDREEQREQMPQQGRREGPPPEAAALDIQGVVKDYRGLRPLRIRSLTVRRGDRVAISGLDATAAEVFVNLVNGAILPDEGEVRVLGLSTAAIADEAAWLASLDRFGIVSPRAVLLDAATLAQNLALPFTLEIDPVPADVAARVGRLAEEVGLEAARLDTRAGEAAPEERLSVHLARAVATDPQMLLLEHPTVPLPRAGAPAFARLVRRVAEARGLTVVAVTEDETFAEIVATAHYRLQGGSGALVNARGWRRWF
jgi:ABC-type transporter Mla maintaining outer membrane lipid asymmetry ATPase subunit MlaF